MERVQTSDLLTGNGLINYFVIVEVGPSFEVLFHHIPGKEVRGLLP